MCHMPLLYACYTPCEVTPCLFQKGIYTCMIIHLCHTTFTCISAFATSYVWEFQKSMHRCIITLTTVCHTARSYLFHNYVMLRRSAYSTSRLWVFSKDMHTCIIILIWRTCICFMRPTQHDVMSLSKRFANTQ